MQYIVLHFILEQGISEPTLLSLSMSRQQLWDPHLRSEFSLYQEPNGTYSVKTTNKTIQVASFADAWIECMKWIDHDIVFLFDPEDKKRLDLLVEQTGYSSLGSEITLVGAWLSRILLPQFAKRDLQAMYHTLCKPNDLPVSDFDIVQCVARELFLRLQALPEATLRILQATMHPVLLRIIRELTESPSRNSVRAQEGIKVIENLAFTTSLEEANHLANEEAFLQVPEQSLAKQSLYILRTQFRAMGDFPYESRPGQEQMLQLVAASLETNTHLIVEAGTGTGKSLAYLLPSALFTIAQNEKVVIATHTIALQEQLHRYDVPLITGPLLQSVRTAILKGRNHYICMRKLNHNIQEIHSLSIQERDFDLGLTVWLTETAAGDREEIAFAESEEEYWRDVASDSNSCIAKRCPFFKECYYFRARHKAAKANLILTNHSLVLSDLKAESRVLPAYDRLIIDEAHQFEDAATKQLGAEVTEADLLRLLERLLHTRTGLLHEALRTVKTESSQGLILGQAFAAVLNQLGRALIRTAQDVRTLFTVIAQYVESMDTSQGEWRLTPERTNEPLYKPVIQAATDIDTCRVLLLEAGNAFAHLAEDAELPDEVMHKISDVFAYAKELQLGLTVCLDVLLLRVSREQFVGWISISGKRNTRRISLQLAPLSVAEILLQELFLKKQSVILTSATLAVANSFSYFLDRIGMSQLVATGSARTEIVASPFDYKRQALLCVVTDLPDIKQQMEFQSAIGKAITEIATTANGRTLVLFTSQQMLAYTYENEREELQHRGITVFAQGFEDHRKTYLIDAFRKAERAILFGLNSFWEGIDIRGDDLSCLIIVKLPFSVPTHPIVEARSEQLTRQGKRPFIEYSVPSAVIRFTQGFGRLIRSKTDRGAVFVLDKRITKTQYGRMFIRSLPDPEIFEGTLQETCIRAQAFFEPAQRI
ncbi:ATP-dependent DNA helicase [Sulfoacidibacillus thermotolerans]|uniref:Helicase ATP-binding domain-containing protein n=1 Tax=Sulfoacidibacillus thermotolerans TaxID=1765684 RepID=A0A2U3D718_SULT2|nr:helicase C-terminal domain-containing protein [Sulfoacidibacillus thermotolerans]PWI57075.1 hypothetical protein BM613_10520 [Sulfoacidibacillus thermotolerans]